MYAVFELSGFQFDAEEGATIKVPKQKSAVGESFDITDVLLLKDKKETYVGTPTVDGAKIEAEVIGEGLSDRLTVYKFKRRTKYRRTAGHRQPYSEIKIKKIVASKS